MGPWLRILGSRLPFMSANSGSMGAQFRARAARPLFRVQAVMTYPALVRRALLACSWLLGAGIAAPALAQVPAEAVSRALDLAVQAARALAPAGARVTAEAGTLDARL